MSNTATNRVIISDASFIRMLDDYLALLRISNIDKKMLESIDSWADAHNKGMDLKGNHRFVVKEIQRLLLIDLGLNITKLEEYLKSLRGEFYQQKGAKGVNLAKGIDTDPKAMKILGTLRKDARNQYIAHLYPDRPQFSIPLNDLSYLLRFFERQYESIRDACVDKEGKPIGALVHNINEMVTSTSTIDILNLLQKDSSETVNKEGSTYGNL